jgi:hypothetical protein
MINRSSGAFLSLVYLPILASVVGCTFSVPQLEAAQSFIRNTAVQNSEDTHVEPATWLASVGGSGALLSPYYAGSLIVFANEDGDAISWDGWMIRSIIGFGGETPLAISGKQGIRSFLSGDQRIDVLCHPWVLTGVTWTQICNNGYGEIVLDDTGNIKEIAMALGNGEIVSLRKAK